MTEAQHGVVNQFTAYHSAVHGTDQRTFGSGWERTFTQQLAFFLACDPDAATAVARGLLGSFEADVKVVSVESQYVAKEGRPDIVLFLGTGNVLLIEAKIDASLGIEQAERYLKIRIEGAENIYLALVGRANFAVPTSVVKHPRYCKCERGDHFLWREVYDMLPVAGQEDGAKLLRDMFRSYMRAVGLAPLRLGEWNRLFEDREDVANRAVQRAFGDQLRGVRQAMAKHGLAVSGASHKSLQGTPREPRRWRHLVVGPRLIDAQLTEPPMAPPFNSDASALAVTLVYEGSPSTFASEDFQRLPKRLAAGGFSWVPFRPQPLDQGRRTRMGLVSPLKPILDSPDLEDALTKVSIPALEVLVNAAL